MSTFITIIHGERLNTVSINLNNCHDIHVCKCEFIQHKCLCYRDLMVVFLCKDSPVQSRSNMYTLTLKCNE